ncbi:hypothetical protein ILYODFUR_035039 [Ilyodon furcidens]|uniref:Uncharacterized protein n=1 Tax=Ilyodon furcidens TaxID=33524 RepID=A0ABV0UDY1_9TELE
MALGTGHWKQEGIPAPLKHLLMILMSYSCRACQLQPPGEQWEDNREAPHKPTHSSGCNTGRVSSRFS